MLLIIVFLIYIPGQLAGSILEITPDLQHHHSGDCFDGSSYPADLQGDWAHQYCYDKKGNEYKKGESLESCCRCFTLTCWSISSPALTYQTWKSYWNLTVNHEYCCQDCHGKLFPAGSMMSKVVKEDKCETTVTNKCISIYNGNVQKAVTSVKFDYGSCCLSPSGLHSLFSTTLDPPTCSRRECVRPEGSLFARWNSTIFHQGCNCCLYEGELIPNGGNVSIGQGVATCCDGTMMMDITTTITTSTFTKTSTAMTKTTAATTTKITTTTAWACAMEDELIAAQILQEELQEKMIDPSLPLDEKFKLFVAYSNLLIQVKELREKCKDETDTQAGRRAMRRVSSCSKLKIEDGLNKIEEKTKDIKACLDDVKCGTAVEELKELTKQFECIDDVDKLFLENVLDNIKIVKE